MTTITFDTLSYANKLKSAGVPDKQAEIQAEALYEIIDDQLSTKKDLLILEGNIRKDIELLKKDLIIKLGSMIIISFMATISILGFLMKFGH